MTIHFLSSGDLIADRRAAYAEMLAANGEVLAAADVMAQALELTPGWVAGWDLLSRYLEKAGDIEGAIAAWRRVEALDAAGIFGAQLKLAAHGAAPLVAETAEAYVEALFDNYAENFDSHLVERLDYVVPAGLMRLIGAAGSAAGKGNGLFAHAIDLGCGTGLMGERLRAHVSFLEGVDLAANMIAQTLRKGIYDRLDKAELSLVLQRSTGTADLVTAADVFCYCGALGPIFAEVAAAMMPGGLFAFSFEALEGDLEIALQPSLRYAHHPYAVRRDLAAIGFEIVAFEPEVLRKDRGEDINGYLVLARKNIAEANKALNPLASLPDADQNIAGDTPPTRH